MAKKSLTVGGTPGAPLVSEALAEKLSVQFRFDDETRRSLLALCPPSEAWRQTYFEPVSSFVTGPDAIVASSIEGCAVRFLRNRIRPAGVPQQREFLEALDVHASALLELLTMFPTMDGTTADFFKFLDRAEHATSGAGRMATYKALATLKLFARYRLVNGLSPDPEDAAVQRVKRKNTYPRFVLVADLMACWTRITGKEPMATASNTDGQRRVSPALEFLSIAMPPILKASRFARSGGNEVIDDQVLRKDMAEIKRFWKEGVRPEMAYAMPDWAKAFGLG